MSLSARTEYACLAVLELAGSYGMGQPVRLREIANHHGIPSAFLVQIFQQLKNSGLVRSTRGAAGGYQLTRPPEQITLADVVDAVEGLPAVLASNASSETAASRVILEKWQEIGEAQRGVLESTTFGDLVERVRPEAETMYYI